MNPIVYTFIKDAIITYCHKKQDSQKSSWLGKKVFLGYSNSRWKVYELSLFDRFARMLNLAYRDTHLKTVVDNFENLTTHDIKLIYDDLGQGGLSGLPQKLQEIFRENVQESKEVIKGSVLLDNEINKTATSLIDEIKGTESAQGNKIKSLKVPPATSPLYLKNYMYSRCYMDSVLEIMLSQDSIRERIFELHANENVSFENKKVLKTLMNLILTVDKIKEHGESDQSLSGKNSPGEEIRKAIFTSQLNPDLSDIEQIYTQQDASACLLLINDLLRNKFDTVEIDTPIIKKKKKDRTIIDKLLNREFARRPAIDNKLELRLREGRVNALQSLVDRFFAPRQGGNERNFEFADKQEISLPYSTQSKLLSLPDSLALHVSRYKFDPQTGEGKATESVRLPEDGIVNFSKHYSGTEPGPHRYEMTGYVVHHGDHLQHGHYTANIKIGNKFYECDDLSPELHTEITAKEFYDNQNAYLVMLKKIPTQTAIDQ